MTPRPIWFRYSSKNSHSIAALLPLVEAGLSRQLKDGIMLYSLATAQAGEVYAEVNRAIEGERDPGEVKGIAYKNQGRLASILIYEQMDFCRSSWFGEQWLESLLD